jgi:hypothetical protein
MYWTGKSGEILRVRRYHRSKPIVVRHIIALLDISTVIGTRTYQTWLRIPPPDRPAQRIFCDSLIILVPQVESLIVAAPDSRKFDVAATAAQ